MKEKEALEASVKALSAAATPAKQDGDEEDGESQNQVQHINGIGIFIPPPTKWPEALCFRVVRPSVRPSVRPVLFVSISQEP